MSKVKTSELIGPTLDWAVAKCNGLLDQWGICVPNGFRPSSDWTQGGLIVERMLEAGLLLQAHPETLCWVASVDSPNRFVRGPSALIAAMRCYVISKLGDEVELPDGLL